MSGGERRVEVKSIVGTTVRLHTCTASILPTAYRLPLTEYDFDYLKPSSGPPSRC